MLVAIARCLQWVDEIWGQCSTFGGRVKCITSIEPSSRWRRDDAIKAMATDAILPRMLIVVRSKNSISLLGHRQNH